MPSGDGLQTGSALLFILAISAATQAIQEVYKYLTRSRSRVYLRALGDFYGSWLPEAFAKGLATDLQSRTPFQVRRVSPVGDPAYFGQKALVVAAERTLPPWSFRCLRALRQETQIQNGQPGVACGPVRELLEELTVRVHADSAVEDGSGADSTELRELRDFLQSSGVPERVDAARTLAAFRYRFAPHIARIEDEHEQFEASFQHSYRRRTFRQTFGIATGSSMLLNGPGVLGAALGTSQGVSLVDIIGRNPLWAADGIAPRLGFLLAALVLGLVTTYGAPFLNDRLQRGPAMTRSAEVLSGDL